MKDFIYKHARLSFTDTLFFYRKRDRYNSKLSVVDYFLFLNSEETEPKICRITTLQCARTHGFRTQSCAIHNYPLR